MHLSCSFFLVAALLFSSLPARATTDGIDRFVEAEMRRQGIPGLSLAVVQDGKLVKSLGFGLANVEHNVPTTAHTIFQSGSVGKQFTATAIMMLVEDGRVRLDEPVSKYLAEAPPHWQGITIRHLLTHTSGTSGYPKDFDFRRDYSEEELVRRLAEVPLAFQPGSDWRYSNVGYVILGALVGKVTGNFYGDFLRQRIFVPAGMTTATIISQEDIVPNRAAGYQLKAGKLKNQDWVSPTLNTTADGSIYLTALDLAKWDLALNDESLLKKASFAQMWSPVELASGDSRPYGFGWQVSTVNGHRLVEHSGDWQGFSTHVARYSDGRLTVVVLANLAKANAASIAHGVAEIHLPELATQRQVVELECSVLDKFVGSYQLTPNMVLSITTEGCRLWSQAAGQERSQLFPESATKFFVKDFDAQITFVEDPSGEVAKLVLHQGGDHEAKRVR